MTGDVYDSMVEYHDRAIGLWADTDKALVAVAVDDCGSLLGI